MFAISSADEFLSLILGNYYEFSKSLLRLISRQRYTFSESGLCLLKNIIFRRLSTKAAEKLSSENGTLDPRKQVN